MIQVKLNRIIKPEGLLVRYRFSRAKLSQLFSKQILFYTIYFFKEKKQKYPTYMTVDNCVRLHNIGQILKLVKRYRDIEIDVKRYCQSI